MLSTSLLRYPGGKSRLVTLIAQAVAALEMYPTDFAGCLRARAVLHSVLLARVGELIFGSVTGYSDCQTTLCDVRP